MADKEILVHFLVKRQFLCTRSLASSTPSHKPIERESKTRIKIDVCKWYRDTRNKQIILTKINNNNRIIKIKIAERGFDPRTCGLLTQQDASTAPLCCQLNMNSKTRNSCKPAAFIRGRANFQTDEFFYLWNLFTRNKVYYGTCENGEWTSLKKIL